MFTISSKSFCYFLNRYMWSSWMSVFSLNQTSEGLCTSWLATSHPLFLWLRRWAPPLLAMPRICLICLQCELLYKLFWESLFNGKNTVSCSWLINAERCISPFFFFFTEAPMSHSYGTFWFPVLSPSVFCPFLPDVLLIKQSLTAYGLTLIQHYSHSLYKNPLGIPISILIPLSIQGNNINHIISYQDDKVGLALSVSCRESCTSFFIGFGPMHSHSCWCLWVANCCLISK